MKTCPVRGGRMHRLTTTQLGPRRPGRPNQVRGERSPTAKLTDAIVREIRRLHADAPAFWGFRSQPCGAWSREWRGVMWEVIEFIGTAIEVALAVSAWALKQIGRGV